MFVSKKRIDDDLEIFQRSLVHMQAPEKALQERPSRIDDSQERLTFSDFIGLCGAAFVVILPWALAFAALMGLVGWLLVLWIS
ncbi:MAG: hypothetical protein LBE55_06350 [Clostridiales bacterium]|jgi:hypothetical protein|nr:hypothetical protein [Clostridiales bacterium]